VQETGYLTKFSANSEGSSNTSSEDPQNLSNVLRGDSNGRVLVKPYRRSSWLFFLFTCSQVHYLVSRPADHHRIRCLFVNNARCEAGGEGLAKGLYEKILKYRTEEGYRGDIHPMVRCYVENEVR
jgi:hypothetical protein